MVNGEWLIYDEYIRKFHILLKRPYVIASEAKQSLRFKYEIATACFAGLAMTSPQIMRDEPPLILHDY
jgi:hypothetical protein